MTRDEAGVEAVKLRMALAEVGYPDADVRVSWDLELGWHTSVGLTSAPDRAVHRAFQIIDPVRTPCWDCWDQSLVADGAEGCEHSMANL